MHAEPMARDSSLSLTITRCFLGSTLEDILVIVTQLLMFHNIVVCNLIDETFMIIQLVTTMTCDLLVSNLDIFLSIKC